MEQFLLDSVPRYQSLVRAFKPPRSNKTAGTTNSSSITVATRIRPMLDDEVASGQVAGVLPRKGGNGSVDIHELRKKVRGPPMLNVSLLSPIYEPILCIHDLLIIYSPSLLLWTRYSARTRPQKIYMKI
jgi:hypothetical protein